MKRNRTNKPLPEWIEILIGLFILILIVIVNFKICPPVTMEDIYNLPVDEFIRLERAIW